MKEAYKYSVDEIFNKMNTSVYGLTQEEADEKSMKEKTRKAHAKFMSPFLITRIVVPAILKSIIILMLFFSVNKIYGASVATTVAFIALSFAELLFVVVARNDSKPVYKIGLFTNKQLIIGVVCIILVQLLVLFTPTLAGLLELEMLSANLYIIAITAAVVFMVLAEILKVIIAKAFEIRRKVLKQRKKNQDKYKTIKIKLDNKELSICLTLYSYVYTKCIYQKGDVNNMNGEINANNNGNTCSNNASNRSSSSNGGFNLSNLFDISKLGNIFNGNARGNNPLNNLRRMFNRNNMGNMNRRYVGSRNMLKVVPIEEAYRRIKSGNVLLIDVRTEMEYKTVRIKGSVNVPLDKIQEEIVNMVSNKDEYIMLYCATGSRVRRAAQILWSLGYTNINIWEGAGINTFAFHDLIVYNRVEQEE